MILKQTYLFSLSIAIIFAFSMCKKDSEVTSVDVGKSYYPLKVGSSIIYDADSIVYDSFTEDTLYYTFQLRETLASKEVDNSGDTVFRLERYRRLDSTAAWNIKDVWVVKDAGARIERVEENQRIVPMVFPVYEGKEWDGNAFNNATEDEEFRYEKVNESFEYENGAFDSTVTVVLREKVNIIEDTVRKEVYAKHIGLVYQEIRNIRFESQSDGSFIAKGFEYYVQFNRKEE